LDSGKEDEKDGDPDLGKVSDGRATNVLW
jgi:hypothetical protein